MAKKWNVQGIMRKFSQEKKKEGFVVLPCGVNG
jgi:hypothetical protein